MPVSLMALADNLALLRVQRSEQGCCAIALIVVGHRSTTPLLDGQSRLRPIQRLNPALFVNAEHDCLLRRIQIQAHHVGHLLQEFRIARQLESLRAMWLQACGRARYCREWTY